MVGMVFYPFENRIAALKNAHILHSGHSHSRILDKKTRPKSPLQPFGPESRNALWGRPERLRRRLGLFRIDYSIK